MIFGVEYGFLCRSDCRLAHLCKLFLRIKRIMFGFVPGNMRIPNMEMDLCEYAGADTYNFFNVNDTYLSV